MKKITFLCFLIGTMYFANAQVLNQNAGWPNAGWTITGTYSTELLAFESNPTTTANFAYDDDDAGNPHEDNIAAESPLIDLTPAFTAGETWLTVSVQYGYRYLDNDRLRFEYWNADTSTWVAWGGNIPGNNTTSTDNYCTTITKTTFTTPTLSIVLFTPTQLSGFKYRISYDDDPIATDWNYGFCFDSPTIVSATPPACPNPTALAAVRTSTSAVLSWVENGSSTLYNVEYGPTGFTQGTGTLLTGVSNSYNLSPLTPNTAYSFYVQSDCGSSTSEWVGPFNFTTLYTPPSNDDCANAIGLTVNSDFACATTTAGTTLGGTLSMAAAPCFGNPDDDVWYSFVATATSHRIVLSNVVAVGGTGTSTDAYMQVLSGACGSQTSVFCSDPNTANFGGLTIGDTYYVRVYTYGSTNSMTFNICVGSPQPSPAAPANDECAGATPLTVNNNLACGTVTAGTTLGATQSMEAAPCTGTPDDDVWYSFVATSTSHTVVLSSIVAVGGVGTSTDAYMQILSGVCGSQTSVLCSDPNTANFGGLTIGETYYVRVYTVSNANNFTFNICVGTPPPPPANDECTGAIALTVNPDFMCGSVTSGTVVGATGSNTDATACFGAEDDDVWFSFVATAATHKISLLNVAGSVTDMFHSLWTGDCNSLTLVAGSCSDSDTSNPSGLTIGQTYYVRVNTYTATSGQTTTFNICIGTTPPPPANDECSGAVALTVNSDYNCGTVTPGTIAGATASSTDATACLGTEDDDVWFSFVATSTAHRISLVNVAGSTTDMYHSLWTGADCASLTLVTGSCSDDNVSNRTGLTIGQTYYVRVYTWTATTGQTSTFNICIGTPPPPPSNDNFATPIAVTCGNVYTGNTSAPATLDEDSAPDGFGADLDAPNLWYSFTGSGTAQTVTVSLCGSSYDTSVLVYTGTTGNLTLIAGNDDDATCVSNTANSSLSFTSDGTTTYYITVEGWNVGSVGAFTMSVTCAAITPPAVSNQDCGTALNILVDGNDNNSDNSFGTVSSTQPTCDLFGSIQDVWFSFVAPASGSVTAILTPGTMTSLNYNVYSGACGTLASVGNCNANLTAVNTQQYTTLTAGQTYYIQVWSNAAEQGTFTLRITDDGLGNGSFDSSNFAYYPNPIKNVLNISYNQDISTVEIYNLLGQKMSSNVIGSNLGQVDMSGMASGAYLVKVTAADNQSKTIRVIKE